MYQSTSVSRVENLVDSTRSWLVQAISVLEERAAVPLSRSPNHFLRTSHQTAAVSRRFTPGV